MRVRCIRVYGARERGGQYNSAVLGQNERNALRVCLMYMAEMGAWVGRGTGGIHHYKFDSVAAPVDHTRSSSSDPLFVELGLT